MTYAFVDALPEVKVPPCAMFLAGGVVFDPRCTREVLRPLSLAFWFARGFREHLGIGNFSVFGHPDKSKVK